MQGLGLRVARAGLWAVLGGWPALQAAAMPAHAERVHVAQTSPVQVVPYLEGEYTVDMFQADMRAKVRT